MIVKPCKYGDNGYCLRNEGDYCGPDECRCPHIASHIKVKSSVAGCETTVQACDDCGAELTPPKTEC